MKNIITKPVFKNFDSVDFTTGVLNIAPIKISGQYKIIIDKNRNLYLDNYCGRRVPLDINTSFLHQVSNFLSVKSILNNTEKLRYGGYESNGTKSFHIPMYLGNFSTDKDKLPRFFCVAHTPNETINNLSTDINNNVLPSDDIRNEKLNIYRYGELVDVVDFEKIGLTKIFEEIISESYFNYPLYFNFEDSNIKLFGQGITEQHPVVKTINILNNLANQPYFDVLNNRILNEFQENDLFYPRFLNIELEFDYESESIAYHNFTGLISYNNIIETESEPKHYDSNTIVYGYIINLLDKHSNWQQVKLGDEIKEKDFIAEKTYDFQINEVSTQPYKFRFKTTACPIDDEIIILDDLNNEIIRFVIESKYVVSDNLYSNWYQLCKHFNKQTNNDFLFSVKKINNYSVEIDIVYESNSLKPYKLQIPKYFDDLDKLYLNNDDADTNENVFKYQFENNCVSLVSGSTYSDQLLYNIFSSDRIRNIKIENCLLPDYEQNFTGFKLMKYDGFKNLQILYDNDLKLIDKQTRLTFDMIGQANKPILLESIPYLTTYDTCISNKIYDFEDYLKKLNQEFNSEIFKKSLKDFNNLYASNYQYVDYLTNIDKQQLNQDLNNEQNIYDLKFKTIGNTAYDTCNLLNIDEQFWKQNGCPDIDNQQFDQLRFAWFSIINYYPKNYRYTSSEYIPNTVSRLIRVSDSICETIYFGVKYQLPIEYENYYFAVVLNWQDQKYIDLETNVRIDKNLRLVTLVINKYIDFSDLIRGGNPKQDGIFNLSLLYNSTNSLNSSSDNISAFKTCGLLLEPYYNGKLVSDNTEIFNLPLFNGSKQQNWIVNENGKQYFCIRRDLNSQTNDFKALFELGDYPNTPTNECYVYTKLDDNKDIKPYKSITVKLRNIVELESDYLWCENVEVKFFDNSNINIQNINDELNSKIKYVKRLRTDDVHDIFDFTNNAWNSHLTTIDTDGSPVVEISNKVFDFKQYYFEIIQETTDNEYGKQQELQVNNFTFTDGFFRNKSGKEMYLHFYGEEKPDKFTISESGFDSLFEREESNVYFNRTTLFEHNQLWLLIQYVFKHNLIFKYQTKSQIQLFTNDFTINKLMENTKLPLPIVDSNRFIKIDVIDINRNNVIWDISKINGVSEKRIVLINRHSAPYFPHFKQINVEDYFDFQLNKYKKFDTIMNIYDKNYGNLILNEIENIDYNYNISATCLWNELHGNIISSLFCLNKKIKIDYHIEKYESIINFRDLLIKYFSYDDLIITDTNVKYLESLNKNIRDFTIESFVDNLLNKYYKLESVCNELGERIYFWSTKNPYEIHFKNPNIYGSDVANFSKITFNFIRK